MADAEEDFFDKIELELNVKIPLHLKKLLTLHGFANNVSMRNISDSDITEIERFTKNELQNIIKSDKIAEYVGLFANNIENFLIFGGEKKLLFAMKEHIENKENLKSKLNQSCSKRSKLTITKTKDNTHDNSPLMAIENMNEERMHLTKLVRKNVNDCIKTLDTNEQEKIVSKLDENSYNCQVDNNGNLYCMISCVLCNLKLKVRIEFINLLIY